MNQTVFKLMNHGYHVLSKHEYHCLIKDHDYLERLKSLEKLGSTAQKNDSVF